MNTILLAAALLAGSQGTGDELVKIAGPGDTIANATWFNITWDTGRNVAYATTWTRQVWKFDPAADRWTMIEGSSGAGDHHNRALAYDPVNDRLWESPGTGPRGGAWRNMTTGAWTEDGLAGGILPNDSGLVYDAERERLVNFGGWADAARTRTLALNPLGSGWVAAGGAEPVFTATLDGPCQMTNIRCGWNGNAKVVWYIDEAAHLWTFDDQWSMASTTGTKPHPFSAFSYDPLRDRYVAWDGGGEWGMMRPSGAAEMGVYVLDPTSLSWSKLTFSPLPPGGWYATFAMVWDPTRGRTILKVSPGGSNYSEETWALTLAGGSPRSPPSPPPPAPNPAPPPTGGGGREGSEGTCGATGMEVLLGAGCIFVFKRRLGSRAR